MDIAAINSATEEKVILREWITYVLTYVFLYLLLLVASDKIFVKTAHDWIGRVKVFIYNNS